MRRETKRNTLAPLTPNKLAYDKGAKHALQLEVKRFFRRAAKALPEFSFKVHFNPGGIAVWGEVYCKISHSGVPLVEAYNVSHWQNGGRLLVRQWDGRNTGRNLYANDLETFVALVRDLSERPFVRF